MDKQKLPYELLVRWDEDGKLKGAHVQFRTIYRDGAEIINERLEQAEPIAVAGNRGFPIGDVLGDVEAAALASVNKAKADADAAVAEGMASVEKNASERIAKIQQEAAGIISQMEVTLAAMTGERDRAAADAASLRAQLATALSAATAAQ